MNNQESITMMEKLQELYKEYELRDKELQKEFEELRNRLEQVGSEAREMRRDYYTMEDDVIEEIGWEEFKEIRDELDIQEDLAYWLPSEYSC